MKGYIYLTTNLINNKKYIGQKKSTYFKGNKYLGSGIRLKEAIKKYGKENFKVELLEEINSLEDLDIAEKSWIEKYNAVESDDFYNLSDGGQHGWNGFTGHKHTEETKSNMSKNRTGEQNSNYGNRWSQSDELKQLHSELSSGENNGMYGKKHSAETKEILSEKALRYCWVCCDETKETLRVLKSEQQDYFNKGFRKGRIFNSSSETIESIS